MSEPILAAGTMLGPYRIVKPLAKGGMGYVYEGFEPSLDRRVAIKIISSELRKNSEFVERFRREAKTLAKMSHPHVVTLYSFGEQNSTQYLVMEFIDGKTLKEMLKEQEFFFGDIAPIMLQTAQGVLAIHEAKMIHRDIKLSNVLVTKNRGVKIGDFGVAKMVGEGAADLTESGILIGTAQYIAPELLAGEAYNERSDIYALGILYFELLCGFNPFLGKSNAETFERINKLKVHFPEPVHALISWELRQLIEKMISRDLASRPSSMHEVIEQLSSALKETTNPLGNMRWPVGLKVGDLKNSISILSQVGCESPLERSYVLAHQLERLGVNVKSPLTCSKADLLLSLEWVRGQSKVLPMIRGSQALPINDSESDVTQPGMRKFPKNLPTEDDSVEIDPDALAQEHRADISAKRKQPMQRKIEGPLEVEFPPKMSSSEQSEPVTMSGAITGFFVRLKKLFFGNS